MMAGVLYIFSYFLDCVDGNLARMTRTETVFGDWFDHISDICKNVIIAFAYVCNKHISSIYKYTFVCGSTVLGVLAMLHVACQEKHSTAKIISPFFTLAKCVASISVTRYFGLGTFTLFQAIMIFAPALCM